MTSGLPLYQWGRQDALNGAAPQMPEDGRDEDTRRYWEGYRSVQKEQQKQIETDAGWNELLDILDEERKNNG